MTDFLTLMRNTRPVTFDKMRNFAERENLPLIDVLTLAVERYVGEEYERKQKNMLDILKEVEKAKQKTLEVFNLPGAKEDQRAIVDPLTDDAVFTWFQYFDASLLK